MSKESLNHCVAFGQSVFSAWALSTMTLATLCCPLPADDDTSQLCRAAPLTFPADKLREWVDKKESQQPPPAAFAIAENPESEQSSLVRLLSEQHYHFTADGKVRVMTWEINKVLDKDGAVSASRVDAVWEPWQSERPTIQARVMNPDGTVVANDGKDAIEQAAGNAEAAVMTDTRQLTLVLHGVEQNSIVETLTTSQESLESGSWFRRASLTDIYPAKVHRLVITYEKGVQLVHRSLGTEHVPELTDAESSPGSSASSAVKKIVYQQDLPPPVLDQMETGCGPDRSSISMIEFGTPRAWVDLGKDYAQSVEKAIAEGNKFGAAMVKSKAAESATWTAQQKVAWCDEQIRKSLRYTSLAFGQQRIYPVSPILFSRAASVIARIMQRYWWPCCVN